MASSFKELLKSFDVSVKAVDSASFNISLADDEVMKYRFINKHWALSDSIENFSVEYGLSYSTSTSRRGKRFGVSKREHIVSWPGGVNRYKGNIG
jgi:hypothetical protein